MKQRYDLLAMSLLMFTAVLTVSLIALPGGIKEWQPIIGASITGLGVIVAAWNVTRQMRLAARGREQDRIEKELPGLRSAHNLVLRFLDRCGTGWPEDPILEAFEEMGALTAWGADFEALIDKAIPSAPDFARGELSFALQLLRDAAQRVHDCQQRYMEVKQEYERSEEDERAVPEARLSLAVRTRDGARERLKRQIAELGKSGEALAIRIAAEENRRRTLRREHDQFLGLDH
ncbi:hypothetical protein [Bradyrhizobium diazoefficiens]|uniref:hypothetical protein n=1 Tax=Bradyrhizobium diazoefficiens TaxID=1355477 RepID=UPI0027147ED6|nr:hypothetical protein [Bradyrhizobium diazoefficiens]WLB42101.1 hypothetical protein QIH78_20610 [Bradyrhizobium diazoefficiens]